MGEYIPHTSDEQAAMLAEIGLSSLEQLFTDIPNQIHERFEPVGFDAFSELEVTRHMQDIATLNLDPSEYVSFMGGGVYDHYVPSVVNHLISRAEFFTSYTPYQAEASQGTLTWMFEFQSLVCELTGMDVANASMYDGGSALAEAMLMAHNATKKSKFLVAASIHPNYKEIIETYRWAADFETVEIPITSNGLLDTEFIKQHVDGNLGGVLVQTPNFYGVIEDLSGIKDIIGDVPLCVSVNPLTLGILKSPGELGADIVTSEAQVFGNAQNFGGPLLGLFAARDKYLRKMPGRISGKTQDHDGNVGYVMTLQTREQHIKRSKATSNICTNQALCALAATIHLAAIGRAGFRELGELNVQKAHYLERKLTEIPEVQLKYDGPFFNEFTLQLAKPAAEVLASLRDRSILGGVDLAHYASPNELLVAVTEKRTREELDEYISAMKEILS